MFDISLPALLSCFEWKDDEDESVDKA